MNVKGQLGSIASDEGAAGAMRIGNFTEVKFSENEEAQQKKGVLADPPRAELPVGKPAGRRPTDDPLGEPLTILEVSELLGCSTWTVRNRHLRRGLPYFRSGGTGKLVFYRSQITRWILDQQALHRGRR
jgi:hypothetical protein